MTNIPDVNSSNWKPTLNLGHDQGERVNNARYERLWECSVLKSSAIEETVDVCEIYDVVDGEESTGSSGLTIASD